MSELKELIEKKEEIEKEIKIKKMEEKKRNSGNNSNGLIRVANEFNKDLEIIIKERFKIKKDKSPISKPQLTSLIRKHKNWGKIRDDCINFEYEEE